MNKEIIEFGVFLTGHSYDDISQMYNDFKKHYVGQSLDKESKKDEVFEKVLQQHIVVAELRDFYRNLYYSK